MGLKAKKKKKINNNNNNHNKINKREDIFWDLQICPSSVKFTSEIST